MKLLLDTHALLWFLEGNSALSQPARLAIEEVANDKFVSHATAWEVAIKLSLGKLTLQVPYEDVFPRVVEANGFLFLTSRFEHYRELLALATYHREPFDRLIISQARVEKLTIITADPHFAAYGVPVLW